MIPSEEIQSQVLLARLLQSVTPEEWERIWEKAGAADRYGVRIDISLTGIELLLRHLASRPA